MVQPCCICIVASGSYHVTLWGLALGEPVPKCSVNNKAVCSLNPEISCFLSMDIHVCTHTYTHTDHVADLALSNKIIKKPKVV